MIAQIISKAMIQQRAMRLLTNVQAAFEKLEGVTEEQTCSGGFKHVTTHTIFDVKVMP